MRRDIVHIGAGQLRYENREIVQTAHELKELGREMNGISRTRAEPWNPESLKRLLASSLLSQRSSALPVVRCWCEPAVSLFRGRAAVLLKPCFPGAYSDQGSYRRRKPRNEQGCMGEQQAMLATSPRHSLGSQGRRAEYKNHPSCYY